MKVFIVSWLDQEDRGHLTPFTSNVKARSFLRSLERGDEEAGIPKAAMIDGLYEEEFPLNKDGVIAALNYGSEKVWR